MPSNNFATLLYAFTSIPVQSYWNYAVHKDINAFSEFNFN